MPEKLLGDIHAPGPAHEEDVHEERLLRPANGLAEVGRDRLASTGLSISHGCSTPGLAIRASIFSAVKYSVLSQRMMPAWVSLMSEACASIFTELPGIKGLMSRLRSG